MVIRQIDKSFCEQLFQMQEEVFEEKIDKNLLRHNTIKNFADIFNKQNVVLGVFDRNTLIGFGILILSNHNEILSNSLIYANTALPCIKNKIFNLNKSINLQITISLEKPIGIVKLIIVKKECRGKGIQMKILKKFDHFYKKFGIKRVICSVSPFNFFSLNNFYSNGFRLIYRKNLYDGYNRLILAKNVKNN